MRIRICFIAEAQLRGTGVGSVVHDVPMFMQSLEAALEGSEFPENGQGFEVLPDTARNAVTSGVAMRTDDPADYRVVEHRGEVILVLDRTRLSLEQRVPDSVAAIVYTAEAVLADPEVSAEDKAYFQENPDDLYLVAVLASRGPRPPLSSHRFTRNLAGGNAKHLSASADELRAEAKEIAEYERTWCVVG